MVRASDNVEPKSFKYDNQIKSSKHDDICLWLSDKLKKEGPSFIYSVFDKDLFSSTTIKAGPKVVWERQISGGSYGKKQALGFIDMSCEMSFKKNNIEEGEFPYINKLAFFEIKTSVNLGETIRQINYYRNNMESDYCGEEILWYVCAPKFGREDVLLDNDIGFIEYKP